MGHELLLQWDRGWVDGKTMKITGSDGSTTACKKKR
jgi:hypothetical protein